VVKAVHANNVVEDSARVKVPAWPQSHAALQKYFVALWKWRFSVPPALLESGRYETRRLVLGTAPV
jgi:hypothetical protein